MTDKAQEANLSDEELYALAKKDPLYKAGYTAALEELKAKLPSDLYSTSKDWRESNALGRIDWLLSGYESVKADRDELVRQLAELAEQEPVAWLHESGSLRLDKNIELIRKELDSWEPLYAKPMPPAQDNEDRVHELELLLSKAKEWLHISDSPRAKALAHEIEIALKEQP